VAPVLRGAGGARCRGGGNRRQRAEPELFEIPAGLPHAIVNRSDREIFLVVFYEEKELQTAPAKLL
jgi:quercetin dioxygenase-like cupin family protein